MLKFSSFDFRIATVRSAAKGSASTLPVFSVLLSHGPITKKTLQDLNELIKLSYQFSFSMFQCLDCLELCVLDL